MTTNPVRLLVVPIALLAVTCSQGSSVSPSAVATGLSSHGSAASQGGTGTNATIDFGQPHGGSPFFPPGSHDHSFNGVDKLTPQTVVIDVGGTVTFKTFGVHEIAIYAAGTQPGDIDTSLLEPPAPTCPPVPLINDPTNRIAELGPQPCDGGPTTVNYTFTESGKYLVICNFLPHFVEAKMYGYVIVRD